MITDCITCDGQTLKALAEAGKDWLESNYQRVNELNVFPVPDGDTGTNMLLTMRNAYQEIAGDTSNSASRIAGRLAYGAIMGSRGNSGTIMSQIWVGFSQGLGEAEAFDVQLAASALKSATEKAYAGVQTPVEGTILTVIREISEEALAIQDSTTNLVSFLEKLVARGWEAVKRTPTLLPVLREAGVVDSGGTGLMYVLEGMYKYLLGEEVKTAAPVKNFEAAIAALDEAEADLELFSDQHYNYDVQFVIKGEGLRVEQIKTDIEAMGDSGVIIGNDQVVKVHIHVDFPSIPIAYGEKLGMLDDVVVENMQAQYEARLKERATRQTESPLNLRKVASGEIAVVAVASGKGLAKVLGDLGINEIIEGGQTNNPSTEEILKAIRATQTNRVVVLPNNKNIILAAQQAAQHSSDIDIKIVPTVTFPQGVAAMLSYRADGDFENVVEAMQDSRTDIVTIEVTTAVRSVEIDGVAVQEGQTIALIDGKLRVAGETDAEVIQQALEEVGMDDYELVTLYYGADVSPEDVDALVETLGATFENLSFEIVYGGQPHYSYILGVE